MINKEVKRIIDLTQESINITVGESESALKFNHFETIRRIEFYINSRYIDNNPGIFWNIINPRIVHFAKNIDLDTKDLQPHAEGEVGYIQSWILKMKFYRWLEDNHFALTLNSRSVGLSGFGSWIWEVSKTGAKTEAVEVPLGNMYFDTTVESIRDTNVVRKYYLTRDEITEKEGIWEHTNTVLDLCKKDTVEIWKFTGTYDGVYQDVYGYGYGDDYIELYTKKLKESPYYDFHVGEYQGRWLRIGVGERLFDLQVLANKLVNQNDKNNDIASLLLLRTANPELMGNALQDVMSGEIINSDDLQQIGITNSQFSTFIAQLQKIEDKADQLCLTPNVITAEATPANMPFRSLATLTNAGKSAFRLIKESVGESTGYLLKERIFPAIVAEWNKGELFEIARDEADLKYFEKQVGKLMRWRTFTKNLLAGRATSMEELDQLDKVLAEGNEEAPKKIQIPKNFFNFKFQIRTNITGEAIDKQQRNDALYNALTWVQSNPAIVNVPYFKQYCEENGINYWRLTPDQVQEMQQQAQPNAPSEAIQTGKTKDKLLSSVDSE